MLLRSVFPINRLIFLFAVPSIFFGMASANAEPDKLSSSLSKAIAADDYCYQTVNDRTVAMTISNKTRWTVEIVFFRAQDESNNVPDQFVDDTGVFVGGTNMAGPSDVRADPCYAGGHRRPIQATRGGASVKLVNPENPADVVLLNLPDAFDGDVTRYYPHIEWEVDYDRTPTKGRYGRPTVAGIKKLKAK